jgi:hypothetical protein
MIYGELWHPCALRLLPIGAQVNFLHGHGYGTIVAYNLMSGFYTGRRYPYVVKFHANGYEDVYCHGSITAVPALPAPLWVNCYQMCCEEDAMCFPWSERVCKTCPNWDEDLLDEEANQYDKDLQAAKEVRAGA